MKLIKFIGAIALSVTLPLTTTQVLAQESTLLTGLASVPGQRVSRIVKYTCLPFAFESPEEFEQKFEDVLKQFADQANDLEVDAVINLTTQQVGQRKNTSYATVCGDFVKLQSSPGRPGNGSNRPDIFQPR